MSAVSQWVSRSTPGGMSWEDPVMTSTTPQGCPPMEEKVDFRFSNGLRGDPPMEVNVEPQDDPPSGNREETGKKVRTTPKDLGTIPKSPTGWSREFEDKESGGFSDEEPTLIRGIRTGFRCLTTIKRVLQALIQRISGGKGKDRSKNQKSCLLIF